MEASIALKNVSKHFKNRYVLSNLNFGVEKGSIFTVLGRNSEGKSTFLKLLSGIYTPSSGKLYINGEEFLENRGKILKDIGYLGDTPIHSKSLTLLQNLKHRAEILGMTDTLFKKNLEPLIEKFRLKDFLDKKASICSTGILKRLEIVLSLLHNPSILIWDEPLAYLDFNLRQVLLKYLLEVKGEKTVVIATNEFTELHTIADRWIVLHNRNIRFDGDLEKMTTQTDLPFIGQLEVGKEASDIINNLHNNELVLNLQEDGNSIEFQCKSLNEFHSIVKEFNPEDILRISCNSIDLEELLNQLLSDEGF